MTTASPTPMGSNHFEPLQTRASTRQGLRRLPSRPASAAATAALTKRTSNPALSHNAAAAANNNLIDSNHNNHSNNNSSAANSKDNDSSDDEIPVPMKLSALTKALLEDDGGVDAQSSQQQQQPRKPSPPLTRQRSNNLAASTSAVPAEERRHRRAGSVQAPVVSQSQQQSSVATHSGSAEGVGGGTSSQQSSPARRTRDDGNNSPVRKRIIRLSTTPKLGAAVGSGRLRRSTSLNASQSRGRPPSRDGSVAGDAVQQSQDAPAATAAEMPNVNTPTAQQPMRVVRIAVGSSGQKRTATAAASSSFVGSARKTDSVEGHVSTAHEQPQHQTDEPATVARSQSAAGSQGSVSRFVPSAARNRFVAGGVGSGGSEDPAAPQGSSMRVKRIGKVPGSFLSGPARRGRRRQSEDENSPADENGEAGIQLPSSSQEEADGGHQRHHRNVELISEAAVGQQPQQQSFYSRGFASGSPDAKDPARARRPAVNQLLSMGSKATADGYSPPNFDELLKLPSGLLPKAQPRPVDLPSARDQENDVGASFRKSALGMMPSDKDLMKPPPRPAVVKMDAAQMQPPAAPVASAIMASPERKPLSMLSQNTPHRPPPPPPTASASMGPPKMSIAETATSAAGAATTAQGANKLRKNVMKVNGKTYTRLDCLGRGGSGKVYRVSAENGKMFALKRVSIEDADESVIKGYRGEIDLLKKLRGVERVISLIDYEMNDEKQMLSLVMEMGDLDLNTLLKLKQSGENVRYDVPFVRFYWKEMLECLQAVHEHDIVHSDLKPANFVLVQGRLKLIDFGIANKIQTDETVNVHRETQIGTPNYMSPESLIDTQATAGAARLPGAGGRPAKLMKLGKPSDMWSLGCILYQMVYGRPPFGHIANNMAKCQAIINWKYDIEFPPVGQGGAPIPASLLRTMRRCLTRDQHRRPTCEELLSPTDPFLYPVEFGADERVMPVTEELLSRIIQSVVARCRDRLPTDAEAMSVWPAAYWASIKKATSASREVAK